MQRLRPALLLPEDRVPTLRLDECDMGDRLGRGPACHTYLINHRPAPGFENEAPYAIAVVELEEGPRMMANIVGVANTPEELELDMPLEVRFESHGEQIVPVFTPAAPAMSPKQQP